MTLPPDVDIVVAAVKYMVAQLTRRQGVRCQESCTILVRYHSAARACHTYLIRLTDTNMRSR